MDISTKNNETHSRPESVRELEINAGAADFTGRWRPGAILEAMQDSATAHSEDLGAGRARMLDNGVLWILSRTHLQMQEYPMLYERARIRTWPGAPNRFFFPRCFVIERPDGRRLGSAAQLWLLLDMNTRTVIPPSKARLRFPDTSSMPLPLPAPDRVRRLESGRAFATERPVAYTDLDVNGHVNNARYADWICDLLPLETLRGHCVENLLLNYVKEARPGPPVRCSLTLEGRRFSLLGESEGGEQVIFEAGGTLSPWRSDRRV